MGDSTTTWINPAGITTPTDGIPAAPAVPAASDATGTSAVATPSPAPAPVEGDAYLQSDSGKSLPAFSSDATGNIQTRYGDKPQHTISTDPAAVTQVSTVGPAGTSEVHSFENVMAVFMRVMAMGLSGATEFVVDDIPVVDDSQHPTLDGSHPLDFLTLAMKVTQGDPSAELDDPGFDISADAALFESAHKFKG